MKLWCTKFKDRVLVKAVCNVEKALVEIPMAFFCLVIAIVQGLEAARIFKYSSMNTNDQYSLNIFINS
jgi:hypothetical protein